MKCSLTQLFQFSVLALGLSGFACADDLVIPGSGNNEFVLGRLAEAFNAQQKRHRISVPPSIGTAGAIRSLDEGTATLVRVGRPLKDAELRKGYAYVPLGRDAVVFAGGAKVTANNISAAQVLAIYQGKTLDWRELGGTPGAIRAVGREATDTSRTAIAVRIKEFADMTFADSVKQVLLDPQAIELLDRFPTSLGFLNRSALSAAKTKLTILSFESIPPSAENIASGQYPIWLEMGFAYKPGGLNEAGREFLAYVSSPAGREIVSALGIIPRSAAAQRR